MMVMHIFYVGQGLWEPEPKKKIGKYATWIKDNGMICAWIINNVISGISEKIMYYKMAKEMWDSMEDTYSHEKNLNPIIQTYYEMMNLKKREKALSQYYSQLKSLIEKYNACWPIYTNDNLSLVSHWSW